MNTLSSELETISDFELHKRTVSVAQKEQQTTLELLYHLHEIERRKLFAQKSYASLFEYVCKALGYSESQTYERISAMRLMFRDENAKEALATGKLTLTQAAMTERFLKTEEKENRAPLQNLEIQSLIQEIEGKSKRETEKILLSVRPSGGRKISEKIRTVSEQLSELKFPVTDESMKQIERFWELKGRCSIAELFLVCLEFYLEQKDPAKRLSKKQNPIKTRTLPAKPDSLPASPDSGDKAGLLQTSNAGKNPSRYIPTSVRQDVRARANERCQYVDTETKRRCESKALLQFDHIHPFAWGGTPDSFNIRMLCSVHNRYEAGRLFGWERMQKNVKPPSIR